MHKPQDDANLVPTFAFVIQLYGHVMHRWQQSSSESTEMKMWNKWPLRRPRIRWQD